MRKKEEESCGLENRDNLYFSGSKIGRRARGLRAVARAGAGGGLARALRGLYREGACTPYGGGNAGHGTALTGAYYGQGAAVLAGSSQVQVPFDAIVPRRPFGETWLRR